MIDQSLIAIGGIIILGIWALYKLHQNFSQRLFYQIGTWLFLIQGVASSYGLFIEWGLLPLWSMIARSGSILFMYLIAYFFYYLMKTAPASMGGAGTTLSPEEINKFLEDEEKDGS